jgi:hypothetical protein
LIFSAWNIDFPRDERGFPLDLGAANGDGFPLLSKDSGQLQHFSQAGQPEWGDFLNFSTRQISTPLSHFKHHPCSKSFSETCFPMI